MPSRVIARSILSKAAWLSCAGWLALSGSLTHAATPADGQPYAGDVRLTIAAPGARAQTQNGKATVSLVPKGEGRADFVIEGGMVGNRTRADLTVKGTYRDGGWHSDPGDVPLSIAPDGRIDGGGHDRGQQLSFRLTGNATANRLQLRNEVTVGAAQGGAAAGTVLTYDYDVRRTPPAAAGQRKESTSAGCRMRMVPIPTFGGGMIMGQVPDCDPD